MILYFNPRSPHGERRAATYRGTPARRISIHAPRTGSDTLGRRERPKTATFQSTLPARGATRQQSQPAASGQQFQSTLPARGATRLAVPEKRPQHISIHAPRTGSDCCLCRLLPCWQDFNPRSPHGERHCSRGRFPPQGNFNPRSPHGERLRKVTILSIRIIGFAQKVYHKTVLLRISLAENAVILPEKPRNPVRTSLQKAGGLRFARAIRAARPYSISSPSGA